MTKLDDKLVTSPDLNRERLENLKAQFPDLFTDEGELDPKALKQLVSGDDTVGREQYAFTWRGKAKAKRHAFTPSRAALTYDSERSVNPEKSKGNTIIEGENLEVLKLLASAYRGKVKCIYIDPPYNRDAEVVYKDNYTEDAKGYWETGGSYENGVKMDTNPESSGRYHSDWLSIIFSRLLLARTFLKDEGVIFVSIDDNEIHNLRKVMDEVFGEENFLGTIIWKKKTNGNNVGHIPPVHDYFLTYAKNATDELRLGFPITKEDIAKTYSNPDNDPRGVWTTSDLSANHKGPYFKVTNPVTGESFLPPEGRYWVFNEGEIKKRIKDGRVIFGKSGTARPVQKVFASDRKFDRFKAESWWDRHGLNSDGTAELKEIFGVAKIFDHPKPTKVLKHIINISTDHDKNDIVMDFFGGTGTVGHATASLNEQDGGNRQYIIVQLPEAIEKDHVAYKAGYKKISDITIERNKRVIEGYGENPQPLDSGFKVYRLTKSHFPRAEFVPDPDKSEEENIKALEKYIADKESSFQLTLDGETVLDEVLLKQGFPLDYTASRQEQFPNNVVYLAEHDGRRAYVCLDPSLDDKTIDYFKRHTETTFICLERSLDTTKKWNLNHSLGERLKAL